MARSGRSGDELISMRAHWLRKRHTRKQFRRCSESFPGGTNALELRNLGRSGLRVSAIGLGCNNFGMRIDLEATRRVVHKALHLGITLFDTADIYGNRGQSETLLGQVLGERRRDIVLATKFG